MAEITLEQLTAKLEELKGAKGGNDEEQRQKEMKRIRREIRKLRGPLPEVEQELDEEGNPIAKAPKPAREKKARTKKSEAEPVHYQPSDELYQAFIDLGLDDRRNTEVLKEETGYMFIPVIMADMDANNPEHFIDKFGERWPGLAPTWFTELTQGPNRCVVLGPVPNQ